jgi:hypothetical protein
MGQRIHDLYKRLAGVENKNTAAPVPIQTSVVKSPINQSSP